MQIQRNHVIWYWWLLALYVSMECFLKMNNAVQCSFNLIGPSLASVFKENLVKRDDTCTSFTKPGTYFISSFWWTTKFGYIQKERNLVWRPSLHHCSCRVGYVSKTVSSRLSKTDVWCQSVPEEAEPWWFEFVMLRSAKKKYEEFCYLPGWS